MNVEGRENRTGRDTLTVVFEHGQKSSWRFGKSFIKCRDTGPCPIDERCSVDKTTVKECCRATSVVGRQGSV